MIFLAACGFHRTTVKLFSAKVPAGDLLFRRSAALRCFFDRRTLGGPDLCRIRGVWLIIRCKKQQIQPDVRGIARISNSCSAAEQRARAGPGMRSGCDPAIPARIGPRARCESPDLTIFPTRTVPVRDGCHAASFLRLFPSRTRGASLGTPPLLAFPGNGRGLFGVDLPRRKVPMLLVPAVGLPLGLPKRIGALLDTPLLLRVHSATPPTHPRRQANPCRSPPQNARCPPRERSLPAAGRRP